MIPKFFMSFSFLFLTLNIFANDVDKIYPAFNFSDGSAEIINSISKSVPEIKQKKFSENDLNLILKKISLNYSFEGLKIVEKNNQLYLVGTQTSQVDNVQFSVSEKISEDDLKTVSGLSLEDAKNEIKIQQAEEKIKSYLKNLGYRNARVTADYKILPQLKRILLFQIEVGAKTLISQIQILGINGKDQTDIEKEIYWHGVGTLLSDDKIKFLASKLRNLFSLKGYYLVAVPSPQIFFNATDTEARLVFKILPKAKYSVEILGAKQFSNLFLSTEVLALDQYFSTEGNFGAELSEKLRTFYQNKGYSQFEVSYYERKEKNNIILSLNIEEGVKSYIRKIEILGQFSKPEKTYVDTFLNLSSQKIQDMVWVRPEAEQSGKNLITSLQNEGFISAKLNRIDVKPAALSDHKLDMSVQIEEGPQTLIEDIQLTNNKNYSDEILLQKMKLKKNTPLDLNVFESSLQNLKIFYAENGFIEMQITNEKKNLISYSDNFLKAEISIDINEGAQVFVGAIVLDGNKLTHDKLILAELEFKVGDLLTPQKIGESISRLQKTGHFASVDISTLEANSNLKERTVIVKMTERKPILLTLGIGATNENERTFQTYLGAAHRNLGGWGRGISLRGEASYNDVFLKFFEYKIAAGYLEPYLFDTRTRFRLNYTTQVNVSDVINRKQTISNSAVWSVEQDFTSHITGIWNIYDITNYVEKGMTIQDEITNNYSGQGFVIASTGPIIDFDYRDQILNPQKGHFSRFTFEYASALLGNNKVDNFIRATGQSTLYIAFHKDQIVWANSLRGGYAAPVDEKKFGVPYDKKGFVLGGRSTIRGFESNEFFPSSSATRPETLGVNYKFNSNVSYKLIKSELRFPLFPKQNISAAVFYDGGQVLIDGVQFSDSYRDAIGIGVRYATPVGPVNLEYAQKLDKKPSESEGAFHLSVGVF